MICTKESVSKLLVGVLERITGLGKGRVIIEGEAGPRPSEGLYCTLWWKDATPEPQNDGDFTDDGPECEYDKSHPLTQHLRNETYCTVQVSFWGKGAFEAALSAVSALQNAQRWFDLWRVLGYGGVDRVQDISAAFRGLLQGRAFFNLSFYACFGAAYPADWFDAVTLDVKANGAVSTLQVPGEEPDCPQPKPLTEAKS